jgi:acetyl-CoA carboxylase biotin carboxylase subunit
VTEETTGEDLIARQLRVAAGEGIGIEQAEVHIVGHAIEVRVNAEDPARDYAPSPGRITEWLPPTGLGVRLDTHARAGYLVPPFYDSMIGKLIVHGKDRSEALDRLKVAIDEFRLVGPKSTLPLAAFIISHPDFRSNRITTRWLEDLGPFDPARSPSYGAH